MPKPITEMEKVTIEVPKAVMDFLRRHESDPEKYLVYSLVEVVKADLDACIWPSPAEIEPILKADLKY